MDALGLDPPTHAALGDASEVEFQDFQDLREGEGPECPPGGGRFLCRAFGWPAPAFQLQHHRQLQPQHHHPGSESSVCHFFSCGKMHWYVVVVFFHDNSRYNVFISYIYWKGQFLHLGHLADMQHLQFQASSSWNFKEKKYLCSLKKRGLLKKLNMTFLWAAAESEKLT